MVRKFIAGVRSIPLRWLVLLGLVAVTGVAALLMRPAAAATYTKPSWSNNSPACECACSNCDCGRCACSGGAPEWFRFGTTGNVDVRTGEFMVDIPLFDVPGLLEPLLFSVRWRSMVSGPSQLGNGTIPSWETWANYVVDNSSDPTAANGNHVDIGRPTGVIDTFTWSGTAYTTSSCAVTDTLTTNGSGHFVLADKYGGTLEFDGLGMPKTLTDTNGNTVQYTYNSSYQVTGMTDTRGGTYSFTSNSHGYLASITDPASRTWSFGYDTHDNLLTITTPATDDQSGGITTTLGYDSLNRLNSITDGRGHTAMGLIDIGSGGKVSALTIDGHATSFQYNTGVTTITDRNGKAHRYYYTGNQVTKTDMLISGASCYATNYTWSGDRIAHVVRPLGGRTDYTWDSNGNLTEKRLRVSDTGTNASTDIVHSWGYNSSSFMTSYTDPLGNEWTYGRDSAGNLTSVTNPTVSSPTSQTSSTSISYNSHGQRTSETDEEGKETDYTYYSTGTSTGLLHLVEADPAGLDLTTEYAYDSAGNPTTVTDARGHDWTKTYDSLRRVTQAQAPSPVSSRVQFHYDGNGNLTEKDVENLDKDNAQVSANPWFTTTYTYTLTNRLASVTEEIDASHTRTTSHDYDNNQNHIRVTKPEGNKEKWTYDERDLVASHIRGETDSAASTESYAYDDDGNMVTRTDGRGHDTTVAYDAFGRRTRVTNALGNYTLWALDKAGNVTEVDRKDSSDATLQRQSYSYDERERLYQTSDLYKDPATTHSDAVTTTQRNKAGRVTSVTNARSKTTTNGYDNAWRLTSTTDAMGNSVSYTLDEDGNRTAWSITEYDGTTAVTHAYGATFDAANRRTTSTETDRTNSSNVLTTSYGYDSRRNLVWLVNAAGNPTRWTFDGLSRMTEKEVALSFGSPIETFTSAITTQWGFDKNDRLVSFKDDAANESTWAYDALDRQATMTYPDATQAAYAYDACDDVTQATDPAGNVVADTFDDVNRNTSRSVTLATGFTDTTSETRTFDALNRLTLTQDDDYKAEYTYGVVGLKSQVYEEKQSYATGTAYLKTVTKTYDSVGNKATEAYPAGLSLAYSYNDIDAYSSISDGTHTIASFDYVGLRAKKTTFQSGATTTNTFTGFRGEIATIKHETSTPTTILELDYAYDAVHDRTYERYGASGSPGDAFAYDKAERLTTAWMGSSTPSNPTGTGVTYTKRIDYNMDDDGNRTSVVVTPYGQSAQTTSYTTNSLNQYTAVGSASPTYDANGNQTDNGTYKFKYNYNNLICEVRLHSNNNLVATYKYDALGRRVEKAVSGGITERYVYSGPETVETYDGSHNWKQSFVFGQGIDNVLTLEQADVLDFNGNSNTTETTRSFYHRNALGSVMEITDMLQAKVCDYRYTPYGGLEMVRSGSTETADPLGQHWSFTGRFYDEESGLQYSRRRYYDPAAGRFLERDPIGYGGGPNLFGYCASDPSDLADPWGQSPDDSPFTVPPHDGPLVIGPLPAGRKGGGLTWGDAAFHFAIDIPPIPSDQRTTSFTRDGVTYSLVWWAAEIGHWEEHHWHGSSPGSSWTDECGDEHQVRGGGGGGVYYLWVHDGWTWQMVFDASGCFGGGCDASDDGGDLWHEFWHWWAGQWTDPKAYVRGLTNAALLASGGGFGRVAKWTDGLSDAAIAAIKDVQGYGVAGANAALSSLDAGAISADITSSVANQMVDLYSGAAAAGTGGATAPARVILWTAIRDAVKGAGR